MKEEPIHNIGTEKWLSMSEAAPFTPYSAEYLSLLARKGKLPSKKIKNTWYTTKNALDAYMQRQMFKAQIELEPIRSYYGDINKYFPQDDTPLPTEKTEHIEKALEKVLEKKITEQEAKNRLEAERVKIRESKFIEPENKSHFKTVLSSKMLVGSTVALFILLSVMPIPIVFSFFDKSLNYVKEVLNDANTVMGFRPGTHANELLLLDKEGNISIMGHIETKGQFKSFVAQGMAPIVVDSKTLVKNLNAEFLGGASSTDFTLAFVTANGNITAENVELQGKVEIGQTLLIRGATKLLSNLDVGGKLKVFGNAEFRQALDVLGPAYFESLVTLANDAKISGNLSVSKNISVRGGLESLSSVIGKSGSFGSLGTGNFSASGKIALNGGSNAVTIDATNITLDKNGNAVFDGNVSALSFNGSSLTIVDATSTNATSTNLFATNATLGNLVLSASTSLQNFTFVNATGTSATTTNFYADKIRSLLATITSIVADDITTGALTATNSTTTSATSTDFFAGTLFARTLNIGGSATSTINSSGDLLVVGSTTLQNFTFVNATGTSATTTNFFTTNASTTDFRTNTATIGTLTSGQTTISNLTSGRIPYISTAGLLADTSALLWDNTLSRLTATNAIFTTSTSTSATSTSFFSTTASSTNLFFTTGNGGNITSTGLGTFANILANASSTFQNFTFTTATGTSATTTNFFSTTASSTNLFSTSLTTGNSTLGAITSGLINSQTISSAADFTGTLNVATGFKIGNAAAAGKILRGNGTNYIASTATLADTYGASELLYSNGANTFTLGGAVTGNSQNITGLNQITVTGITATSTFSTGGLTVGTSQFVVQQNSGNVGIGTTGPQGRLVVKDTGQAVNTWTSLADAATDASFRFFGSSHANEYGIFMGYANTANDAQGIQATQTGGAFAYPLLLNPFGGNVGIGTTTPQYLLDVAGAAIINGVGVATFANEPTLNEIVLRLGAGAGGQGVDRGSALVFGGPLNNNDATQATYGIVAGFKDADASGTGTGGLRFYTANNTTAAEAMRNTGSGNVGIGTTSPVSKLSVLGESAFAGGASVGIGYAGTAAPTGGLIIQGNVGIGTTGPAGKLDIRSSATYLDTRWQVGGDNDFFFRIISNGSEKAGISYDATDNLLELCHSEFGVSPTSCSHLVIANGKVGIGTTTPVSTLSIQGSLCVRDTGSCGTTAGTIYATTAAITDIDLAENYSTRDTTLSAGEVVAFDTTGAVMVKRAIAGDRLAGVISTAPGVLLGKELTNSKPVALAGRVPVKVSLEGGPILIGDYLSLSSIPGVAKKAGDGEQSIGYALEDYTETSSASTIQLFVTHSNLSGLSLTDLTEKLSQEPAPDSLASKFLSNLFARITTWLADVSNGIERIFVKTISSEIVYTKELCIDDICINKEQFKTLLEKNGIGVTVSAMTSEPSINSESTPVVEATPEASPEVIPESISTSEPAPTVEPVSEPTSEVTSTPEPTPESEPEPEPTPTPEVTPQSSDEPTADEAEPAPEPPAE
ncbi:MAG: helix-turn-helix domain-containing protein [Candidatus Zambryskibacteria bacterium]|nr:helix-turn-helix domain-containing protein [Candidatus Zambryskibacteria bacterium]